MALPTYLGYPVLTWEPDWSSSTSDWEFVRKKNRWDNGIGRVRDDSPDTLGPRTQRPPRYVFGSKAEIEEARDFILNTAQGRLKPYWLPTWIPDLPLVDRCDATEAVLTVRPFGYGAYLAGASVGRSHVAVFPWRASPLTILYREVLSSAVNLDGNEELTLDAVLGQHLEVDEMVCWLMLCRANSDDLALRWQNPQVAILEMPMIDVPLETP